MFFWGEMHHVHSIPFRINVFDLRWVLIYLWIFTPKLGYLGEMNPLCDGFFKWLAGTTKYLRHPKREVFGIPILHDLLLEI